MERKSRKITAFLLAFLMILSVCLPSAGSLGLNGVNAEGEVCYEDGTDQTLTTATDGDATTEAAQASTEESMGSTTTEEAASAMAVSLTQANEPMKIAESNGSGSTGDDGLTVKNFSVKVNGKTLEDSDSVQNGAPFEVSFDWEIKNNSHDEGFEFTVDLGAENFKINNYEESVLKNRAGAVVGEWWIENGKMHIKLNDEFVKESYIDGGANLKGVIDAGDGGGQAQDNVQFKIGDKEYNVDVKFSDESGLGVYKDSDGEAYFDNAGNLYQKFIVKLTPWNGMVSLEGIIDTAEGFDSGSMKNITMKLPDSGAAQTYNSWEELNKALGEQNLNANQSIEITYEMKVSNPKDALKQTPSNALKNTVTVNYEDNKNNKKEAKDDAAPNIPKPSIGKSGTVIEEDGKTYVEWTVTVDPGAFNLKDLSSVKDELGEYLTVENPDSVWKALEEALKKDGKYTYRTEVDSGILGTPVSQTVNNKIITEFEVENEKYDYEYEGQAVISPTDILEKEAMKYDESRNVVSWQITIHVPDSGTLKSVKMNDSPDSYWHTLNHTMTVDGTLVYSDNQIKDTSILTACDWNNWDGIVFNDEYISKNAGKDIVILLETTLTEQALNSLEATLSNTVNLSYTYDEKSGFQSETASYEFHKPKRALEKSATISEKYRNTVDYTLDVNLTMLDLKEGDTITVNDILPENMHLVGTPDYSVKWIHNQYWSDLNSYNGLTYENNNDLLVFQLPVSKEFLDFMNSNNNSVEEIHLIINYSAQVDKEHLVEMLESGQEENFKNKAELYKNKDELGTAEKDIPLKYDSITSKNGTYPKEETDIKYEIFVNPDALDLVAGSDKLTGVDVSGQALLLKNGTVHIYEYTGSGNPETDTQNWTECKDAYYTYDQKGRKITFTLPDEKALKITYEMAINLLVDNDKKDQLTDANSNNTFTLYGEGQKGAISKNSWNSAVQVPSVWSNSRTGYITIYKFWTDNGKMKALNGSKFDLYQCTWDKNGIINPKAEYKESLEVTDVNGTVKNNKALAYDNVYALYEVKAKDGYVCNTESYYFALVEDSVSEEAKKKFPSNVDLYFSDEAAYIYYENQPADAKLVLQKSFETEAGVDLDELEKEAVSLTFTVKNSADEIVGEPYTLSDFTKENNLYELELDVEPGTYTIEETKTDIYGYVLESTTYTVTATPENGKSNLTGTGTSLSAEVAEGGTTTVKFTNKYKKDTEPAAKIVLKKNFTGVTGTDLTVLQQRAGEKLTFTVFDSKGEQVGDPIKYSDFHKDDMGILLYELKVKPGTYTVKETAENINGYVLEETSYTVTAASTTDGKGASTGEISLQNGDTATVEFINNYKIPVAKLALQKNLKGDTGVDIDALQKSAKDITFKIKDSSGKTIASYPLSKFTSVTGTDGVYELELELDPGTYTVEETETTLEGFELQSAVYSVTLKPETGNQTTSNGEMTETGEVKTGNIELNDGDEASIVFTNTYKNEDKKGTLVLKKTIKGSVTPEEAAGALKFKVKSKDGAYPETTYTLGDGDFKYDSANDEYILTLDDLPAGEYTVTETVTDITGHVLESVTYSVGVESATGKEASVEVTAGGSIEVAFEDNYREAVGTLVIEKTINGEVTKEEANGALKFTVKDPSGNETEYTLDKFDYDENTGKYTLTLNDQALGSYTVTETVTDITGKVLESVTYSVDNLEPVYGTVAETELNADGSESTVAFQNNYIDEKNAGKLVLQKTIEGSVTKEEAEGALQFTVKNEKTGTVNTYYLKDFDYNEETGIYTKELDVAAGEYTVTESVRDVDGHVLKSVSYTVSGSEAKSTDDKGSVGVNVEEKGKVTVTFKDDYEKATGTLVLKKTIKGAITKEEAEGALEFTVKNNTTKEEKTYTLKDFKYDDKTGEYTLTLPLEEGGYTVTESTKDVNGYVLDSVTYSVNGGDATKGDSVTTDLKAKETVTIAFEDDYSKSKTESSSEQVTETTTETTIITTENVTETETQTSAKSEVKTGDKAPIILVCILLLVSAAAGGIVIGIKMKNKKDQ